MVFLNFFSCFSVNWLTLIKSISSEDKILEYIEIKLMLKNLFKAKVKGLVSLLMKVSIETTTSPNFRLLIIVLFGNVNFWKHICLYFKDKFWPMFILILSSIFIFGVESLSADVFFLRLLVDFAFSSLHPILWLFSNGFSIISN